MEEHFIKDGSLNGGDTWFAILKSANVAVDQIWSHVIQPSRLFVLVGIGLAVAVGLGLWRRLAGRGTNV